MRLPPIIRILTEDLPSEVSGWIGKLTEPLNSFMLTIRNGLNKGITINENLAGAIKTVEIPKITTPATTRSVEFSYARSPKALILGNWTNITDSSWVPTTVGISLRWVFTGTTVICYFYGLDTTDKYSINLVIFED